MKLSLPGAEIAFTESGQGVPVLWIHAFPLHRGLWSQVQKPLSAVVRSLAPDLRGFGESRALSPAQSVDDYADDLAALVRARQVGPVIVAGCSLGGYVAFSFYRRHRQLVRGLILMDTKAGPDTPEASATRRESAARVEEGHSAAFLAALLPRLLGRQTQSERPGITSAVRRMMEEASPAGIAAALRAMAARPDSSPLLASMSAPALVLVGEEDTLTTPGETSLWAGAIPGARLAVIPGAGHLAPLEQPERVAAEILPFVRACAG